jgi:hypothetical protein
MEAHVLQRNVSGSPLVLPTLDPPAHVLPGDTIDHPTLLAGFEVADTSQSTVDSKSKPAVEQPKPAAPSATTDEEVSR